MILRNLYADRHATRMKTAARTTPAKRCGNRARIEHVMVLEVLPSNELKAPILFSVWGSTDKSHCAN